MRRILFGVALCGALVPAVRLAAATDGEIIPETTAQRHGLTRPWLAQVQLDRGRARIRDVVLYEGILYVQTDRATIHALDAETGQSLWVKQVGRPEHPSMTPSAHLDLLAAVNGSRLYVLNRYNGDLVYETQVNGAPGAGPCLSGKRVYVPMVSGMILAYRLDPITDPLKELGKVSKKEPTEEEKKLLEEERRQNIRIRQDYIPPLACQSAGRAMVQPVVTFEDRNEEFVAWATDRGYLNVGRIDRRGEDGLVLRFRLLTGQAITAAPAYLPPDPKIVGDSGTIFATSRDGFIYAVLEKSRERTGEMLWKFSAAEPMVEPAVVIENHVYATTQLGGMYCLDAKNGKQVWWIPEMARFVAASKQRVYAADRLGRVAVLDAATGGRLDTLPTEMLPIKVTNSQTDRLYLGTETGLLQCLHEAEQVKPIQWGESRKAAVEEEEPKPHPKAKAGGEQPEDAGDGEKPAPKPKAVPKDRPPPKDRPAVKDRPVKDKPAPKPRVPRGKKGQDALGGGDVGGGALGGPLDQPAGKAGKRTPLRQKPGRGGNMGPGGAAPPAGDNPLVPGGAGGAAPGPLGQ